jgi:hypothetical protein
MDMELTETILYLQHKHLPVAVVVVVIKVPQHLAPVGRAVRVVAPLLKEEQIMAALVYPVKEIQEDQMPAQAAAVDPAAVAPAAQVQHRHLALTCPAATAELHHHIQYRELQLIMLEEEEEERGMDLAYRVALAADRVVAAAAALLAIQERQQ